MPTRYYFPRIGDATTPALPAPVSPAFSASWGVTTNAQRALTSRIKTGTPLSSETSTNYADTIATVHNQLHKQFVSEPIAAQTISGSFTFVLRGGESNALLDASLQCIIRVVSNDGLTVRGTLYGGHTSAINTTAGAKGCELPTTTATRYWSATTMTSVIAQDGDRLVIEMGRRNANTVTTNYNAFFTWGDAGGVADHALSQGVTTSMCPWLEFTQDIISQPKHKADTLVDAFDTQSANWTGFIAARTFVAGGDLTISPNNASQTLSLRSVSKYDLTSSRHFARLANLPTSPDGYAALGVELEANVAGAEIQVRSNGDVVARLLSAGVASEEITTGAAATARYVSVSADATNIYWQVSANGTAWTTLRTVAQGTTLVPTNTVLYLSATNGASGGTHTAVFSSANTVEPGGVDARTGSFVLSGGGSLTATGRAAKRGSLALSGGGSLTAAGRHGAKTALTLSGGGSLALTGKALRRTSFVLTGGGALTAAGVAARRGSFALSGGGSLTLTGIAAVTRKDAAGSFALSGGGSLALAGRVAKRGSLALSGGGSLTAIGAKARAVTLTLSGGGSLALTGRHGARRAFVLSGGGALALTGRTAKRGSFALSGGGSLTAAGTQSVVIVRSGSFVLSGGGSLTATGRHGARRTFTLPGGGALALAGRHGARRVFVLSGGGSLTATGKAARRVSFALSGGGSLALTGRTLRRVSFVLPGGGSLAATGESARFVVLLLSGGGALVLTGGRGGTGAHDDELRVSLPKLSDDTASISPRSLAVGSVYLHDTIAGVSPMRATAHVSRRYSAGPPTTEKP